MKIEKEYHCDCCNASLKKYDIKGFSRFFLEDTLSDYFSRPFADLVSNNLKNEKFSTIKRVCLTILWEYGNMSYSEMAGIYNLTIVNISTYTRRVKESNNHDYSKIKSQLEKQ